MRSEQAFVRDTPFNPFRNQLRGGSASLSVAVPAATLSRHVVARTLWSAYPLLVFFVIVATGNHFWLDAAAGAAVACLAALAARALARLRPALWSWPDATREATI